MSDTALAGYEEGPNKVIRLVKKHIAWLLRCSKTKIRFLGPLHAINILEINRFSFFSRPCIVATSLEPDRAV